MFAWHLSYIEYELILAGNEVVWCWIQRMEMDMYLNYIKDELIYIEEICCDVKLIIRGGHGSDIWHF